MGHTDAWGESTPLGTENASTADNYLRNHRRDLGERLEKMFYGFNASDNTGAENEVGIKYLKLYKQTSDPTAVTDYGHFYVKLVDGVPELFYQDDENTTLQLTSGGKLYSSGNFAVAGNTALTGTLDVTGNIDPTTYEATNGGFLNHDSMTGAADNTVASSDSIVKYATLDAGGVLMHDAEGAFQNADVNGSKTKVYTLYLTGTLDADASTTIAHGVASGLTKILAVNFTAYNSNSSTQICFDMKMAASANNAYDVRYDDTNITVGTVGSYVQGQVYRVRIDYIL